MKSLARRNGNMRLASPAANSRSLLRGDLTDLFPEAWVTPYFQAPASELAAMMRIDVRESGNELIVRAEVPGIPADSLTVTLDGDQLKLSGEKPASADSGVTGLHFSECAFGRVQRVVELPFEIDADGVRASYEHGVLTVNLPKAKELQARKVDIQIG